MLLRKFFLLGFVASVLACSPNGRDPIRQGDDSSIVPGGDDSADNRGDANGGDAADASGGTAGADPGSGTSDDAGGGGASGGIPGSEVTSKCGGPLDTTAPTEASVGRDGPLEVSSYSMGVAASPDYKSLTVFYPTDGTGPYAVVMISPGLTEVLSYLRGWANRFASHGYVAVFVEANNTNADSAQARANGMWSGIKSMKAENERAGSPLFRKISNCFIASGHSLGGGASLLTAKAHPNDLKAAVGFNPWEPSTSFASVVAPTLILTGQNDTTASPSSHGRRQYDSLSKGISKQYVEAAGGNHQSALFPGSLPGRYALSWVKYVVDGDKRYRQFLERAANGLSDFATTLP